VGFILFAGSRLLLRKGVFLQGLKSDLSDRDPRDWKPRLFKTRLSKGMQVFLWR
jgi:hypothetical protein